MRKLRGLGFAGPFSGTRHDFMTFHHYRQTIPSNSEYSTPQLRMLLRQIETVLGRKISAEEWESLR